MQPKTKSRMVKVKDKMLLTSAIGAYLPYRLSVIANVWDEDGECEVTKALTAYELNSDGYLECLEMDYTFEVQDVKPVLNPMTADVSDKGLQWLIENKYDVFGLIDKGYAVDKG